MGAFTKGDVVLFPFPYTDLTARKLRPCLVISETMREDIILCQITSQRIPKDEHSVLVTTTDTQEGSLQIDSYARANMIFTASINQILKKMCKLKDKKYAEITTTISKIIEKSS